MNKKSLLALAIAGIAGSQAASAAPSADVYGFVDIGLEHYNESGLSNGTDVFPGGDTPNGNSDAQEFALTNNVQSRIGIKGEEEIEDGWKGTYRMEFRADVLDNTGDSYGLRTRLGWLGLEKGDHHFKVGTQWSPFMQYSAWNTARGESQGLAAYFYVTDELKGSMAYGFRNNSVISYTYGDGGWGTASPYTGTIALHVGDDDRNVGVQEDLTNDAGITGVSVAGAATFGSLTLNAVYVKNLVSASDEAAANLDAAKLTADAAQIAAAKDLISEPAIYGVGAKMQATKDLEFGFAYRGADRDTKENNYTYTTSVSTQYQFDEKTNIHLGVGVGEDEDSSARQLKSNFYGQVWYQVTDSRSVRFEFDHADYGDDGEVLATLVSMRQAF
tara:strand:+ start:1784 stop:2944 length:1161 start_codon:yes stop_codon:yes gene_type:complete